MDDPVFEIPQKKYGKESQVITMRMTRQMLAAIDEAARASNRSRNEIVTMALEFSLEHVVISDETPAKGKPDTLTITRKAKKANPADET